jgi:hypothetical protein
LTVLPRAIANLKAFEYHRDSEGALTIQGFETCAGRGDKATSQSVEVGGNDWTAFRIGHDGELARIPYAGEYARQCELSFSTYKDLERL